MLRQASVVFVVSVLFIAGASTLCFADPIVLHDHFEGSLDPAWSVSFEGEATTWTTETEGTWFCVRDVNDTHWDDDSSSDTYTWGLVTMTRPLSHALNGDFQMDAHIRWNYMHGNYKPPMQEQLILLCDASGNVVAGVGEHDCWVGKMGKRWATVGGSTQIDGALGGATNDRYVRIMREGDDVDVYWKDSMSFGEDDIFWSGTTSSPITQVKIQYGFFGWGGSGGPSRFQDEGIDFITVTDNVIPEPTTCLLLGTGIVGLIGVVRRRRR